MSFLKITDISKRDFIVEEFLKCKKNYQAKLFIREIRRYWTSKRTNEDVQTNRWLSINNFERAKGIVIDYKRTLGRDILCSKIASSFYFSIVKNSPIQTVSVDRSVRRIPCIRCQNLRIGRDCDQVPTAIRFRLKKTADTTFGINSKARVFYIGNSPISIQSNDVTVGLGDKTYAGTPGLWE